MFVVQIFSQVPVFSMRAYTHAGPRASGWSVHLPCSKAYLHRTNRGIVVILFHCIGVIITSRTSNHNSNNDSIWRGVSHQTEKKALWVLKNCAFLLLPPAKKSLTAIKCQKEEGKEPLAVVCGEVKKPIGQKWTLCPLCMSETTEERLLLDETAHCESQR